MYNQSEDNMLDDKNKHGCDHPGINNELGQSDFHSRLKILINAHRNNRTFAIACGISQSGLVRIISGGLPSMQMLISISKANNVNIEWLATGEGEMYKTCEKNAPSRLKHKPHDIDTLGNSIDAIELYFAPKYDIAASAGNGAAIGHEAPAYHIPFSKKWIDTVLQVNPKGLAVIDVKGDSMMPDINDKDMLLVNTADTAIKDGIYVIRLNNDLIVKRIHYMIGGTISIVSTNPIYPTFQININNIPSDFAIIGRVVWFGHAVP